VGKSKESKSASWASSIAGWDPMAVALWERELRGKNLPARRDELLAQAAADQKKDPRSRGGPGPAQVARFGGSC
jgi:hypothetical protein